MKISYNWLKEYIDVNESPEELGALLTATGLEVESLERVQSVPGGLEGLVVGEVLSRWQHPNADRLSLTKVNTGAGEPLQIVCGAPNVAEGQKVVVATVGTVLYPSSGESFEIKKSKIRGEESFGMLCAEDEIGLGSGHEGIMVLPEDAVPGTPLKDYFGLNDDWVFEIGLTPNRADAASHIGVARDVAAVLRKRLKYPSVASFREGSGSPLAVRVENASDCPRYSGLVIRGVKVGESPEWLQERLKAIGVKCINNIVDITNYVLHETGQPLHAFDLDKIRGGELIVKNLPEGTAFLTLDGQERRLSERDLMICDAEGGMCIAGVLGGIESGISTATANVFLESAYFNPVSIRRTAKRHGLKTDASFRFERGTDPNITLFALKRAALMIMEVAGGEAASALVDIYPEEIRKAELSLDYARVRKLIGKDIPAEEMRSILEHLEMDILEERPEGLSLAVPTNKVDVTREIDVIEEILRIYGYDNIEMPSKVNASLSYSRKPDAAVLRNHISDFLSAKGFFEIMTNSLGSSSHTALVEELRPEESVRILNPLSAELDQMRQTLLFSGLQSLAYNLNRRNSDLKFYEFGTIYRRRGDAFEERKQLALYLSGRKYPEMWNSRTDKINIYYLKGILEALFQKLGIQLPPVAASEGSQLEQAFEWKQGELSLVRAGMLGQPLLNAFDIDAPVFYAELEWEELMKLHASQEVRYREVPRFPAVRRDLALLVDNAVDFEQLKQIARREEQKLLKEVSIFDVYTPRNGENFPAGKKSYALSFILRDEQKTLTDQQIEKVMQRLIRAYEKEGIDIRK